MFQLVYSNSSLTQENYMHTDMSDMWDKVNKHDIGATYDLIQWHEWALHLRVVDDALTLQSIGIFQLIDRDVTLWPRNLRVNFSSLCTSDLIYPQTRFTSHRSCGSYFFDHCCSLTFQVNSIPPTRIFTPFLSSKICIRMNEGSHCYPLDFDIRFSSTKLSFHMASHFRSISIKFMMTLYPESFYDHSS